MPKRYSFAEEKIKAIAKKKVKRGKAEISIMVENITEDDMLVKLNTLVAKQYIDNLNELKNTYGLSGDIDIQLVSTMLLLPPIIWMICVLLKAASLPRIL